MIYINRMRIVQWMMNWVAFGALAACGGGGGSSGNVQEVVPAGTISTFAVTGVTISDPKHMVFLPGGSDLFVANQTRNEVLRIDANGQGSVYSSITSPIGLAFSNALATDPRNTLYATSNGQGVVLAIDSTVQTVLNAYGLAFASNKVYVAKTNSTSVNVYDSSNFNPLQPITLQPGPKSVLSDGGNYLYFSIGGDPGHLQRFEISSRNLVELTTGSVNLRNPNGLALDSSGVLYVLNEGDPASGDGGFIVKVANPSKPNLGSAASISVDSSIFVDVDSGLCAAAGLAYRDGYLYVSNGSTCTEANGVPNQNTILKVKT
jgi:hypothetical protein